MRDAKIQSQFFLGMVYIHMRYGLIASRMKIQDGIGFFRKFQKG